MVPVVVPAGKRLGFAGLFPTGGIRTVFRHLPHAMRTAWKAVGQADLIHSGVAGWPIPAGAIVNPIAVARGKPLIIVVESAFWRLPEDQKGSKASLRSRLHEWFARWSLSRTRLGIYTHAGYRKSLPVGRSGKGIILPASWISEHDILSGRDAEALWNVKTGKPRFLLASRLVEQKGVSLFLDAMRILEAQDIPLEVDVIGDGPLKSEIAALVQAAKAMKLRLLDPVPYGTAFMTLLQGYHGTIVPLTGDEQARILYDSFSQAVPVIASDTPGNREVVTDGVTGALFKAGSPEDLAETLKRFASQPASLRSMGLEATRHAALHTHAAMHEKRARLLRETFGTKP